MSDFHARVMNIQAVEMCKGKSGADRVRNLCYKEGHKSARHAAAEIANEADAAIAAKDAEIARLRDALAPFAEISKHFNDGESGLIHGWHSTKVGSSEISVEHVHAARAAMAGGGGVSGWMPIESAPRGVFLRTMRSSECGENIALLAKHGDEWVDRFGRTTITHSTFLAPTHWMKLTERPE